MIMPHTKTLIILSPGFAKNEADTSCLPAQQSLVRSMNTLFPSVKIIILAFQYPFTNHSYEWLGNTVVPFNGKNRGKLYKLLIWLKVWFTLKRISKQEPVMGLLSFWLGECAFIGHYFGKRMHLPHFTWVLGQDARESNRYAKLMPLHNTSLVAMSDFLAKTFYVNYGVKPANIITHGIEPELFGKMPLTKDIDIIGVGSLIPLKRYDLFIDIIALIHEQTPELRVIICGEGPEKEKLQNLIRHYGLENTITLTGEKPHAEVLQLMQRSKILLHTSSYEGFVGVCIEALYAGAHVLSFFKPMDEWIRHWHVVETNDDMVNFLLEILQSDTIAYEQLLPYRMRDSAIAFMKLFNSQSLCD